MRSLSLNLGLVASVFCLSANVYAAETTAQTTSKIEIPKIDLNFSGFVDLRFRDVNSSVQGQGRGAESGFLVEDAAFYLSKKSNKLNLLIDLPFSRQKEDAAGATGAVTPQLYKSSGPDLEFATRKAQVVASYQALEWLKVSLGQFDTIFGYELNDSKDRFFGQTGLVYNYALPVTHVGVLGEIVSHGFTLKLMAANPNGRGSRDNTDNTGQSTTNGEDNTEYGATIGRSGNIWRAQLGYATRPRLAYDVTRKQRTLFDVVAGVTLFEHLNVDAELALVNDPAKDTDGDGDYDTGGEGQGYMLHVTYDLNDQWKVGGRYEIADNRLDSLFKQTQAWATGVHYQFESDASLRGEFVQYDLDPGHGVANQRLSVFAIGGLVTF